MKKVALITNFNISEKLSAAMQVAERIAPRVEEILIPVTYKDRIFRNKSHRPGFSYRTPEQIYGEAELVIVLGGDGAMLDAARRTAGTTIPVLGINMGRVGYMTELEMDELSLIDRVFEGQYHLDERTMLQAMSEAGFYAPCPFLELVKKPEGVIGLGAKMGEGWLLTAEMIELTEGGYGNIVCAQPFGCLPNHICGKGMVRKIRELYPDANIVPIDYDPSATRVNQENRIKLMLSIAKEKI